MDIDLSNFDFSKDITNIIPRNEFDELLSNGPQFCTESASNDDLCLFKDDQESFLFDSVKEININMDDICKHDCKFKESDIEEVITEVKQSALNESSQVTLFSIQSENGMIPVQIPTNYPLHCNLLVSFDKNSIEGCHYLARDQPYLFNIHYELPTTSISFSLNIKLTPTESGRSEILAFCTKHNIDSWFSCNGMNIQRGKFVKVPLPNNRCERSLCVKFPCNSSCTSMYSKFCLQFEVVDQFEQVYNLKTFKIRVSERPGRDEREVCGKLGYSPTILRPINHIASLNNDSQLIRKEIPKLVDYTVPNCRFNVHLSSENKFWEGNKFTEKIDQPIIFDVTDVFVPQCQGNLIIRSMIIDPKSPETPIICRKGHECHNILQTMDTIHRYAGSIDGIYPDERLSLLIPLQSRFSLQFKCKNVDFLKADRKFAGLVIILEDECGNMFARRFFKFGIVARPSRSHLNYDVDDSNSVSGEGKKKREATSSSLASKKFKASMDNVLYCIKEEAEIS